MARLGKINRSQDGSIENLEYLLQTVLTEIHSLVIGVAFVEYRQP